MVQPVARIKLKCIDIEYEDADRQDRYANVCFNEKEVEHLDPDDPYTDDVIEELIHEQVMDAWESDMPSAEDIHDLDKIWDWQATHPRSIDRKCFEITVTDGDGHDHYLDLCLNGTDIGHIPRRPTFPSRSSKRHMHKITRQVERAARKALAPYLAPVIRNYWDNNGPDQYEQSYGGTVDEVKEWMRKEGIGGPGRVQPPRRRPRVRKKKGVHKKKAGYRVASGPAKKVPQSIKSEKERMIDFFFGPRRGDAD